MSDPSEDLLPLVRAAATDLRSELVELLRSGGGGESLDRLVAQSLDGCLARLAETGCWGPSNRLPSSQLWQIAGDILRHGDLQRHAREKPRGYAGDFEMLEKICDHFHGEEPLGAAFDRYFQSQAAPAAVRGRTESMAREIVRRRQAAGEGRFHIVSAGSGPAREIRLALQTLPEAAREAIRVTLVDFDPQALEYAAGTMHPLLASGGLTCVQANLSRLTRDPRAAERIGNADYLFCTGFFDYLEDDAAAQMLALFQRSLTPSGALTVFNFALDNPSRAYMEWIGNWYLIYRDEPGMRQLGLRAGLPADRLTTRSVEHGVLVRLDAVA